MRRKRNNPFPLAGVAVAAALAAGVGALLLTKRKNAVLRSRNAQGTTFETTPSREGGVTKEAASFVEPGRDCFVATNGSPGLFVDGVPEGDNVAFEAVSRFDGGDFLSGRVIDPRALQQDTFSVPLSAISGFGDCSINT